MVAHLLLDQVVHFRVDFTQGLRFTLRSAC
eukprot:COSAG01_NODE_48656_length_379_cov_0.742857_1_plen_29_part_10